MLGFVLLWVTGLTVLAQIDPVSKKDSASKTKDIHSFSNPDKYRGKHIDLDWVIDFDKKTISGSAILTFERTTAGSDSPLILDTQKLRIYDVLGSSDGGKTFKPLDFEVGKGNKILGEPLSIDLQKDVNKVKIEYSTEPDAPGLQWLSPAQTAGKKMPFMYSQGQAILARSYVPIQDTPQIRLTYSAKVKTPKGFLAVMSANGNSQNNEREGIYEFEMDKPIPSYLITIAVGDIAFKPTGPRTGVYAEPTVVDKAAKEFEDTEKMIVATETVYGKYQWGRYDIIVLPPSFPFGGMENPVLTFATPTVIAGDKSLVSLVAHELAHSWSGNLVTNATWEDGWLNEGFTTYLTYRIIQQVFGDKQYLMEAALGKNGLIEELAVTEPRDQILHVDLEDRDPDDGFTGVPYEKGAQFLRFLEERFGRDRFDLFLNEYFGSHKFQSITTDDFRQYLKEHLINKYPGVVTQDEITEWLEKPGLPISAPKIDSEALKQAQTAAKEFVEGKPAKSLDTKGWVTQQWIKFLKDMPEGVGSSKMKDLDSVFNFTEAGNSEVLFQWLMMAIREGYTPAEERLEEFLVTVGRRKFVKPLFESLVKTPEGRKRAIIIYKKARPGYHSVTSGTIDDLLRESSSSQ